MSERERKFVPANDETEMHGNGHKYAISVEQQNALFAMLTGGYSLRASLGRCGIPIQTFEDWMRKGGDVLSRSKYRIPIELAVEPYKTFAMRVRISQAEAEMEASNRVMESRDWRAHAWYLKQQFPESWNTPNKKPSAANDPVQNEDASENVVHLYIPDNGRNLEDKS